LGNEFWESLDFCYRAGKWRTKTDDKALVSLKIKKNSKEMEKGYPIDIVFDIFGQANDRVFLKESLLIKVVYLNRMTGNISFLH